jgi:hypothetical protein
MATPSLRPLVHRLLPLGALLAVVLGPAARADNPAVTVAVDAAAARHPINPQVYGIAYGDEATLRDLNCPLNRLGGNNASRYNWQLNADNRGSDWYFESSGDASAIAGERADRFVAASFAAAAQPMVTVPTIGWVAKVGPARAKLASFSIAKYGAQQGNDWQWFADAGNGVRPNGSFVTGNDPNDANVAVNSLYQKAWVAHLVSRWGDAASGGLRYYILDNEPTIWHSTHRDVHPVGATMDELRDKILDYAAKIKAGDPTAVVVGPEEWGWSGYLLSGYDQQWGSLHGWSNLPDRAAHGGQDFLPWLLDQLHARNTATGQRLLDVFSVHYYPQGGEFSNDVSSAMQLRRNRSTRSLWDPAYVDETWIADTVRLVPRLKEWVAAHYPGTKSAVTEYNWGAEGHINGATAQADVWGIFGREALDMAARWTVPDAATPTYKAMKLYRNYDGHGSAFGDTSVQVTAPTPDALSAFAALRSVDGALTVMVVGKALSGATPLTVSLAGFSAGAKAQAWQLTSANSIRRLADVAVSANRLAVSIPAQSVTLFVVPKAVAAGPTLSINDVAVDEGKAGSKAAVFTVRLSSASAQGATVSYATSNGTATAGSDYVATAGSLSFPPGAVTRTLSVAVKGDRSVEPDETFVVTLSSPVGAVLGDGQGQGTIRNDDRAAAPRVSALPDAAAPGETVQVNVANGPGRRLDWVGLFAATAPDWAPVGWKYLSDSQTPPAAGLASATVAFAMPDVPGTYTFRLFGDGSARVAISNRVTVR